MDVHSPAFAAWVIGIGLLPFNRENASAAIPNDAKARYLRALQFVGLTEETVSRSRAARAAGIPWGTVASWIHRDSDFKESVSKVLQQAERELADPEPLLEGTDLEEIKRIEELPEIEVARIAAGEVPSRRFMAAAFPPGEDGGASAEYGDWLWPFPAGVSGEPFPAGRVRPRALAVVPDVTDTPIEGNRQAEGPEEESEPPATPPAA